MKTSFVTLTLAIIAGVANAHTHSVSVTLRPSKTVLSFIDNTSAYQQIFNPTWVEASAGTKGKKGLIARTQNCVSEPGDACTFCGGSAAKASILTFMEQTSLGNFQYAYSSSVVFGPVRYLKNYHIII